MICIIREQRIQAIIEKINKYGVVSVDELTRTFNASRSTIHRDLCELEELNELKCVRGGAVKVKHRTSQEAPFSVRKDLFISEKQRIAQAAVNFLEENETLFLDSGTTVFEFANCLAKVNKPLYVATNDLQSAMALSENDNINLTILGGSLRKGHYSLTGYFTENMISQIHADRMFLGADAIDFNIGYMNFSLEEIQAKRLMIQASHEVTLLADHSKFESVAFVNICPLDGVDLIITGKEIKEEYIKTLEEKEIKVITV